MAAAEEEEADAEVAGEAAGHERPSVGSMGAPPRRAKARPTARTFQTVPLGLNTLQWHGEDEEEDSQVI